MKRDEEPLPIEPGQAQFEDRRERMRALREMGAAVWNRPYQIVMGDDGRYARRCPESAGDQRCVRPVDHTDPHRGPILHS